MAVQLSTLVADVWASIGTEVVIFTITLACAFLLKAIHPAQLPTKKGMTKGSGRSKLDHFGGDVAATKSAMGARSPTTTTNPSSSPNRKDVSPREEVRTPPRGTRRPYGGATQSPAMVMNEIVEGMKEQQSLKFMFRALSMYDELRSTLATDGTNINDAARFSRHSAIDFYQTLVQCAVRAGRQHLVETIIDDMIRQGIPRPLVFYESTMKQLAGQKQYQLALAVYDRLAADGLEPSAITCSCLIGFAAEAGEYQRAIVFFDKLAAMATPSIRAYMTVLRVHAKRQDWQSSLAKIRDMQQRAVPLDCLALNIALSTGVAADRLDGVTALLAEAESHKPPVSDVVSYNTLIKGHAQRGDADGALQAMIRMRDRGLRPNAITFNTAMDACVRGARVLDAWKLLDQMRVARLRPDKFTCSILVKGMTHEPDTQKVESALALLAEVNGSCDNALRSTMYNAVLEAAAQVEGNPPLLSTAFRQMRQHGVTPLVSAHRLLAEKMPGSETAQN